MLRKKSLWIYTAIVCLVLSLCVFMAVTSRTQQTVRGEHAFEEGMAEETIIYDQIALSPGVYEVKLQYHTDRDYSGYCMVQDATLNPKALVTNGTHLYAGLSQTSYYVWLYRPTTNLQIVISYGGEAALETGDLTIRNTGKLWSMLFVMAFGIALAGYGILVAVSKAGQSGMHPETKWVVAGIGLIAVCASVSQLGGYLLGGADLTYHLQRIEGVKDSLLTGQFPIRIEPRWLYDHGYANGIFYCDVLLYFPALLRLAGFTIATSYNCYCILLNIVTAWIAWYCFTRIFNDYRIGMMCSALYTLSLFRIYMLAVVGAVGEGTAATFLPLIFYGMHRIFTGDEKSREYRSSWLWLAFGYAGILQSHMLSCEIAGFLTIILCIIGVKKILKGPAFLELLKGALGALGLSLWYVVPFLDYYLTQDIHVRHIGGRTIQERGFYLAQLFTPSFGARAQAYLEQRGMVDMEPIGPGLICFLTAIVFLILLIGGKLACHKENEGERGILLTAKVSAFYACMLLAMTLRIFPWDRIQRSNELVNVLVSSLQFPRRFLSWSMVFLVMLFGTCMMHYAKKRFAYWMGLLCVILSCITGSFGMIKEAMNPEHRLYLYNEDGMGFGYISGAEYLVEGTDETLLTFTGPKPSENLELLQYEKKGLRAQFTCQNMSASDAFLDLPLLHYKGYQAKTEEGQRLEVTDGVNHLVRVVVPAGYGGTIRVAFVSPLYWRISEIVSLICLLVIGGIVISSLNKSAEKGIIPLLWKSLHQK